MTGEITKTKRKSILNFILLKISFENFKTKLLFTNIQNNEHILNVHIKDRPLGGGTVPLGEGNADILGVIKALETASYKGLYIFQTAL